MTRLRKPTILVQKLKSIFCFYLKVTLVLNPETPSVRPLAKSAFHTWLVADALEENGCIS